MSAAAQNIMKGISRQISPNLTFSNCFSNLRPLNQTINFSIALAKSEFVQQKPALQALNVQIKGFESFPNKNSYESRDEDATMFRECILTMNPIEF